MKRQFDPQKALRELVRIGSTDRFDIQIDYAGDWYYKGSRIERIELVRLFATVLRRAETGEHWLITPVEQGRIEVADAPFVIVDVRPGETFEFVDNLDRAHKLFANGTLELVPQGHGRGDVPYLEIEHGLRARLLPKVFYELVELAEPFEDGLGFKSDGRVFRLGEIA